MKKNVLNELNQQINEELYSAYLYLALAAYYDSLNLPGFSNWMKVQAKEETTHAMKFYEYIYDRGDSVSLDALKKPKNDFSSALAGFEEALKHEKHITARIDFLYDLAVKEKDYSLMSFLKWFIDEQVEEEKNALNVIERLKLAGEKGPGLLILDKELGERK